MKLKVYNMENQNEFVALMIDDGTFNYHCYASDRAFLSLKFGDNTTQEDFSEIVGALTFFTGKNAVCVFTNDKDEDLTSFQFFKVFINSRNDQFFLQDKEVQIYGYIENPND